jgi:hypothetical protein
MVGTVEEKPVKLVLLLSGSTLGLVAWNWWQRFARTPHIQLIEPICRCVVRAGMRRPPPQSHFDSQKA